MTILTTAITTTAIALTAASANAADVAKGFIAKDVEVTGKQVKYVVYVPRTYDPAKPMPAIIFLNGMGECGTDGFKQLSAGLGTAIMVNPDKWPFIVMFPQKQHTHGKWEEEDDMVMAILEKTRREYSINDSRLYLTGLSQGGHGTWTIAAKHPDLFAAIAPVCGWGDESIAKALAKMPIWVFHGDQDEAVKVQSAYDMQKWLQACGGTCQMSIYPGVGHNSWDRAYREEDLAQWFLKHKK